MDASVVASMTLGARDIVLSTWSMWTVNHLLGADQKALTALVRAAADFNRAAG